MVGVIEMPEASRLTPSIPPAIEKDEFVRIVAGGIGEECSVGSSAVPIQIARGFFHTATVSVIRVGNTTSSKTVIFRVVRIPVCAIAEHVSRRVIRVAVDLILGTDGHTERCPATSGKSLREQVAPRVVRVRVLPSW